MLIYKGVDWLDFTLEGLRAAKNSTEYRLIVVANDATSEIENHPEVTHILRNIDPSEYYISRVYRAWNLAVEYSTTEYVVLISSDMYVSDYWLDELLGAFRRGSTLPTSMLVESGQLLSKCPQWERDLGRTPATFDRAAWVAHAAGVRRLGEITDGLLYGPVFLEKSVFLRLGGYPTERTTIPGDQILFAHYQDAGYTHITALGSVVYHVQEGEMRT